jgi:hypothetical protein
MTPLLAAAPLAPVLQSPVISQSSYRLFLVLFFLAAKSKINGYAASQAPVGLPSLR